MREGKNMGIMTTFKKPTLERARRVHGAGATPLQTESTRYVRRFPPHGRPAQRSTASPSPMWTRPDSFPARCLYTTCPPLALGSEAAPMVSTASPGPRRKGDSGGRCALAYWPPSGV